MNGVEFDRLRQHVGRRIVSAVITPVPRSLPEGLFDQAPRVIATLDNGEDVELFSFYAHERSFTGEHFIGLTVEEGRRLKFAPAHRLDLRVEPRREC